jgi:hypothetical protein
MVFTQQKKGLIAQFLEQDFALFCQPVRSRHNGKQPLRAQVKSFQVMAAQRHGQDGKVNLAGAQPVHQACRDIFRHINRCLGILPGKQRQRQWQKIWGDCGYHANAHGTGNGRLPFRDFVLGGL